MLRELIRAKETCIVTQSVWVQESSSNDLRLRARQESMVGSQESLLREMRPLSHGFTSASRQTLRYNFYYKDKICETWVRTIVCMWSTQVRFAAPQKVSLHTAKSNTCVQLSGVKP